MAKHAGNRTGRQAKRRRARHERRSDPWRRFRGLTAGIFAVDRPGVVTFSNAFSKPMTYKSVLAALAELEALRDGKRDEDFRARYFRLQVLPVNPRLFIKIETC